MTKDQSKTDRQGPTIQEDYMDFVQIAVSMEYGAYYYELSTGRLYHIPYEELLDWSDTSFSSLTGWLIGSFLVAAGTISYTKQLHFRHHTAPLLWIPIGSLLGAVLICCLVRSHQKKTAQRIRDRASALRRSPHIAQTIRQGRKIYIQLTVYIVVLFIMSLVCFAISVSSSQVLFALFAILFFDAGVMTAAILQPLGKMAAYTKLKRSGG